MVFPDAVQTNAFSNALHAIFLFCYFIGALVHLIRKDHNFSLLIVLFFFNILVLKLLGIYVHYYELSGMTAPWIAICLLTLMMNYLLVEATDMSVISRVLLVFFSIVCTFFYLTQDGFVYIAMMILVTTLAMAYFTSSMLRWGFLMTVLSNVVWIAARQIENHLLGHEISTAYRYDNDVYHLMLIISTFIIYKSIVKGYWKQPVFHS